MSTVASSSPAPPEAPAPAGHGLRHIPELDGIRGIAALVVFGHHGFTTTVRETLQGGWPASVQNLSRLFEFGNTGVDLFFVLSGFLITSILLGERRSPRYYHDFYWKRALRILPLYIVMLAIAWIFLRQTTYTLMALAFVVNFAGFAHVHLIEAGPFWSLGIEEQFYLLWPTLVRRFDVRHVLRWSIVLGVGCMLFRAAMALRHHNDYNLTPMRCDGLAFGAALACHFFVAGRDIKRRRKVVPLLLALLAAGVVLVLTRQHTGMLYNASFQTGVVLITGPLIGLSIAYTGARVLAPLRSRILTFFGLISYAFYMVHIYVIMLYRHFMGRLQPGDLRGYWMEIIITFAASVGLSLVSRYALELPAMGLRRYVLKHPNPRAEQAQPPLPLAQM